MHGLGNDFVLIDGRDKAISDRLSAIGELSKRFCDRRFGIGADQLLLLSPSTVADFRMRIFNADGGEVEMCGNGIRCLAKYIWDRGLSRNSIIGVETLAGIIKPERVGDLVRVDMGMPILEPEKIPVKISQQSALGSQGSRMIDYPLQIEDREFKITCVSMGNPHAVIVVDNVSEFPVAYYGPLIEKHPLFPKRTNVEFIELSGPTEISMRVWERGSGETLACGTGACAVAVAAHLKGLAERDVVVRLAGGDLSIAWAEDGHVYMTGPATEVFNGEIDI